MRSAAFTLPLLPAALALQSSTPLVKDTNETAPGKPGSGLSYVLFLPPANGTNSTEPTKSTPSGPSYVWIPSPQSSGSQSYDDEPVTPTSSGQYSVPEEYDEPQASSTASSQPYIIWVPSNTTTATNSSDAEEYDEPEPEPTSTGSAKPYFIWIPLPPSNATKGTSSNSTEAQGAYRRSNTITFNPQDLDLTPVDPKWLEGLGPAIVNEKRDALEINPEKVDLTNIKPFVVKSWNPFNGIPIQNEKRNLVDFLDNLNHADLSGVELPTERRSDTQTANINDLPHISLEDLRNGGFGIGPVVNERTDARKERRRRQQLAQAK